MPFLMIMEEITLYRPDLIGREEEFQFLKSTLSKTMDGKGATLFIGGEAGIGKTRLVYELIKEAEARGAKLIHGWCLAESLEPLMPIKTALRKGGMQHLMSGDPPPIVVSAYLMNAGGMLINRSERRESGLDPDIFASMLQAVGNFVKDSLAIMDEGAQATLNSLGFGDYTIFIQSANDISLAVVIKGTNSEFLIEDMKNTLDEIGSRYKDWIGNVKHTEGTQAMVSWFVDSGKYDGEFLVDDPKIKQENLFDNILLGIQRASEDRTLLLFLDDLQWSDPTTLNLVHYLSRNTRKNRVLILGTYRPEDIVEEFQGGAHHLETAMQGMTREDLLEKMKLSRLDVNDTSKMVESVLGQIDFDHGFFEKVYKETDGSPFFILEVIKMLVEDQVLTIDDGFWHLSKELDDLNVPSKVYDVVKRRLNRLAKEQKDILECASVVGEEFWSDIVGEVIGMNKIQLLRNLSDIEKIHQLIHYLQDRYRFDHAKIKEVLYKGIGEELRKEYHRIIGDTMIELNPDDPNSIISDLAYHYYEAGDVKGGGYLTKAGNIAKERFANLEAISLYTKASELLKDDEGLKANYENLGEIYGLIGEFDNSLKYTKAALEMAEKLGQVDDAMNFMNSLGSTYLEIGNWDMARESFDIVLAYAEEQDDECIRAMAYRGLGKLAWRTGSFDEAKTCSYRCIPIYERTKDRKSLGFVYKDLGDVFGECGDYDTGLEYYKKSVGMFDPNKDNYNIGNINMNMGVILSLKKDWNGAAIHYETCIDILEKEGYINTIAWALFNLGEAYTKLNEFERAEKALNKSAKLLEKADDEMGLAGVSMKFGELYKEQEEFERAVPYFESSAKTLRKLKIPKYLADVTHELGLTLVALDRKEEAREKYEEAIQLYSELGIEETLAKVKKDLDDIS